MVPIYIDIEYGDVTNTAVSPLASETIFLFGNDRPICLRIESISSWFKNRKSQINMKGVLLIAGSSCVAQLNNNMMFVMVFCCASYVLQYFLGNSRHTI